MRWIFFTFFFLSALHAAPFDVANYRKAAERGDPQAQYVMGIQKLNDRAHADPAGAAEWYRKSAEQGYAPGEYSFALCLLNGWGVEKNQAEALNWLRKAAEKNLVIAQFYLGNCYLFGLGTGKNQQEALVWLRKAAAPNPRNVCREAENISPELKQFSDRGHPEAQYTLGVIYENGHGVEQDPKSAFDWYYMAAEQNHAAAQYAVGNCFARGFGVVRDQGSALVWRKKAEAQGYRGVPKGIAFALPGALHSLDAAEKLTLAVLQADEQRNSAVQAFTAGIPGFVASGSAAFDYALNHNRTVLAERNAIREAAAAAREALRKEWMRLPEKERRELQRAIESEWTAPAGSFFPYTSLARLLNPNEEMLRVDDWVNSAAFLSKRIEKNPEAERGRVIISLQMTPFSRSAADVSITAFRQEIDAALRTELVQGLLPPSGARLFFIHSESGLSPFYIAFAAEQVYTDRQGVTTPEEKRRAADESLRKAETALLTRLGRSTFPASTHSQRWIDDSGLWVYTLIFLNSGVELSPVDAAKLTNLGDHP